MQRRHAALLLRKIHYFVNAVSLAQEAQRNQTQRKAYSRDVVMYTHNNSSHGDDYTRNNWLSAKDRNVLFNHHDDELRMDSVPFNRLLSEEDNLRK